MESLSGHVFSQGTAEAADGSVDKTIIAAPGAGKVVRVMKGILTVTVATAGNTGFASLEDGAGGTKFITMDADSVGEFAFDFGSRGFALTAGNALNLTVDGDGGTEATATATVVAYTVT